MNQQDVFLVAMTVALEAGVETLQGKVAVAFVIRNRMKALNRTASQIVFQPKQFSCWNDSFAGNQMNLSQMFVSQVWADCMNAVSVMLREEPDPTFGATSYLNEALTLKMNGSLPGWTGTMTKTASIGRQSFYK